MEPGRRCIIVWEDIIPLAARFVCMKIIRAGQGGLRVFSLLVASLITEEGTRGEKCQSIVVFFIQKLSFGR